MLRKFLLAVAVLASVACTVDNYDVTAKSLPKIAFQWGKPLILGPGGYVRVRVLQDGRLMCTYTSGGTAYAQYSSDGGASWTGRQAVVTSFTATNENGSTTVNISNPEVAQLSKSHTKHPGRLIYAVNLRPKNYRTTVHPYSIAYTVSDDGGMTWSPLDVIYQSEQWDKDTEKGCWEPFVQELPDGKLQMYFSDETPYYRQGNKYQNISVLESTDGGDSWSGPRIVCYSERFRDGMPVTTLYDGKIYLSIETNRTNVRLHPQILYCDIKDNWSSTVDISSRQRFDPFLESLESPDFTTGAPYLIQTDKFFVISYQTSENADIKVSKQRVMHVQACLKSEMKNSTFNSMRGVSSPIDVLPTEHSVMWNSLCPLSGDEIMACCQYDNKVALVKGKVYLPVSVRETDILEKAEQLFHYIPDHKKVSEKARPFMTADLYESLSAAWDVPMWHDGELGDEDFLFYFITGNDPSDKQQVKSAELVSVHDGKYTVNVKYLEFWGNSSADNLTSITLILVDDNGNLLLDDFGNGVKSRCKQYIQEEVNNYLSGKTGKYMKDNQNGDWYTDKHISNVNKSFKEFLSRYKIN